MDEKTTIIVFSIIIINLIISGIVGLIKKSINMHSIVWSIMFFPLGIIGGLLSQAFSLTKKPEEGNLAIVASISCFAMALLLTTFLTAQYIPMADLVVPLILLCIIIGLPIVIIIYHKNKE